MDRRERIRELLDRRGLDGIALRRAQNFAWYTNGGDSRVEHADPVGVADLVVTRDAEFVLASTIEAPRMRAEQAVGFEVLEYPWYEDRDAHLRALAGEAVVLDSELAAEIAALRRVLDPDAIERLRAIGRDVTAAMAEAAAQVAPGMSEFEAAAALQAACLRRGLAASVLLAAADERIAHHRHPVPVGATINRRAMLVASAERGGLYANLTRIVELDQPEAELARRVAACDEILARMREEATRPGRTLGEAFADCTRFYAEAGFPDQWRLHHQGGSSGYASRETIATPDSDEEIEVGQAFAWNPSVTGAKSEETFALTGSGPEVIAGAALAVA
jgi:Xaa-Pro dipeptidase